MVHRTNRLLRVVVGTLPAMPAIRMAARGWVQLPPIAEGMGGGEVLPPTRVGTNGKAVGRLTRRAGDEVGVALRLTGVGIDVVPLVLRFAR